MEWCSGVEEWRGGVVEGWGGGEEGNNRENKVGCSSEGSEVDKRQHVHGLITSPKLSPNGDARA